MFSELLQMDAKTIYQINIWCNLFVCLLVGSYCFSYATNENRKTLKWFGLSKLLFAISMVLNFCRGLVPDEILFAVTITSFLTAWYFESITILQLLNFVPKRLYRLQFSILTASVLILNFVVFTGGGLKERVLVYSLSMPVILLIPIVKFFIEKSRNLFLTIYILAYIVYSMSIAVRGIHFFLSFSLKVLSMETLDVTVYISGFLLLFTSTIGFLLLIKEKQDLKIQRLLNDKDHFLSIISHDLRAPLNSAIIMTDILHKKFGQFSPEKVQDYLRIIHEGNQKNLELLENLLNWSKVQNGLMEFNPQKLDLDQLINENIELNKQLAVDKDIILSFHCIEPFEVLVDKNMVDTVIRNLIANAVKFNKRNGYITVEAVKNNQEVMISVADTGMGMDEKTKKQLFKVNEGGVENSTESKFTKGLGLLLCKEFVKRHDGRIWVESELGKGSIFKFTLPLN